MAAHRQAPRGVPMWSLWMPSPTSTASAAEHSRLAVSARACAAHQGDKPLFQQQNAHPAGRAGQKAGLAQLAAHNAGGQRPMQAPASFQGGIQRLEQ